MKQWLTVVILLVALSFSHVIYLHQSALEQTVKTPVHPDDPPHHLPLSSTSSPEYLLSVPFYIYEGFGLPHEIALNETDFSLRDTKHMDDILLLQQAIVHPMRTTDPDKAKLFYIPTPFNEIFSYMKEHPVKSSREPICLNNDPALCNARFISYVNRQLNQSIYFQRHGGKDHMAVMSVFWWNRHPEAWAYHNSRIAKKPPKAVYECNLIDFEGYSKRLDRLYAPSYYVGTPCSLASYKTHDFAMIARFKRVREYTDRQNICNYMKETKYTMPVCGEGTQCPTLAQAKFGFHASGDTPGANRLMDTILSGTVPIFTSKEQYDVLPQWIDWKSMSYFANISDKRAFLSDIRRIASEEVEYLERYQNVLNNRHLFDYSKEKPFDTYMFMLQCKLFPESCRGVKSRYSALIIPN